MTVNLLKPGTPVYRNEIPYRDREIAAAVVAILGPQWQAGEKIDLTALTHTSGIVVDFCTLLVPDDESSYGETGAMAVRASKSGDEIDLGEPHVQLYKPNEENPDGPVGWTPLDTLADLIAGVARRALAHNSTVARALPGVVLRLQAPRPAFQPPAEADPIRVGASVYDSMPGRQLLRTDIRTAPDGMPCGDYLPELRNGSRWDQAPAHLPLSTLTRGQVLRILREHMDSRPWTRASVMDTGTVYISTGALAARYLPLHPYRPGDGRPACPEDATAPAYLVEHHDPAREPEVRTGGFLAKELRRLIAEYKGAAALEPDGTIRLTFTYGRGTGEPGPVLAATPVDDPGHERCARCGLWAREHLSWGYHSCGAFLPSAG
ncbi:hypothetical protein [Kitasatospora sp. NPDC090091]|uniref:hypothetical protein n=1 Tax=Kitasatospora sp. NPDC090091 TaxID=3364081 RepID=UPI0038098D20